MSCIRSLLWSAVHSGPQHSVEIKHNSGICVHLWRRLPKPCIRAWSGLTVSGSVEICADCALELVTTTLQWEQEHRRGQVPCAASCTHNSHTNTARWCSQMLCVYLPLLLACIQNISRPCTCKPVIYFCT